MLRNTYTRSLATLLLAATGPLLSLQVNALAMGPEEFTAAKSMTCVLARESLGQFTGDEYASHTRKVLDGFDQSESDVIYAKALGYYDGLMFGIPADSTREVNQRLRDFVDSRACSSFVSVGVSL